MDNRPIRYLAIRNSSARLIVLAVLFVAAVILSVPAWPAAAQSLPKAISLDQVTSGMLLLRTKTPGRYLPAPTIMTKVDMRISGMVARVELQQCF